MLKKSDLIQKLTLVVQEENKDELLSDKQKQAVAHQTVTLFFDYIKEALKQGDRVEIRGFGTFNLKKYDGYTGRNPKTGETIKVKPKRLPVFRIGRSLKKKIKELKKKG